MVICYISDDMNFADLRKFGIAGIDITCSDEVANVRDVFRSFSLYHLYRW